MKKFITQLFVFCSIVVNAQDVTKYLNGHYIGNSVSSPANAARCMMSEIEFINGEYILYYTIDDPSFPGMIAFATSTDLQNWTIEDTCLSGSFPTSDRTYVLGGPRVIPISGGQYRMFYRCCPAYIPPTEPGYHIRSAISSDGKNWTPEGVRIEINDYDANSYFIHVGHSEFFYDSGGNLHAFLTAMDTTMTNGPDKIYFASSIDEGLTWSNFSSLYADCHDPVIILDSSGLYHAFFTYLNTGFKTATSATGTIWPMTPDDLYLIEGMDTLIEAGNPVKIADLGAVVDSNGEIIITSNYSSAPGPFTEIAYYKTNPPIGINEVNSFDDFLVFPNPASTQISFGDFQFPSMLHLISLEGKEIFKLESSDFNYDISNIAPGYYHYKFECKDRSILKTGKIVVMK